MGLDSSPPGVAGAVRGTKPDYNYTGSGPKLLPSERVDQEVLWIFLDKEGVEPTNNAAERTLRQSVIQRKISHGVQSRQGAICRSRLLTVSTTLR